MVNISNKRIKIFVIFRVEKIQIVKFVLKKIIIIIIIIMQHNVLIFSSEMVVSFHLKSFSESASDLRYYINFYNQKIKKIHIFN